MCNTWSEVIVTTLVSVTVDEDAAACHYGTQRLRNFLIDAPLHVLAKLGPLRPMHRVPSVVRRPSGSDGRQDLLTQHTTIALGFNRF